MKDSMKRLNLILVLMVTLFAVGCTGTETESNNTGEEGGARMPGKEIGQMTAGDQGFCLAQEGNEDCYKEVGKVYLIKRTNKALTATPFEQELANHPENWVSLSEMTPMGRESYQIFQDGENLIIRGKNNEIKTQADKGVLFYVDEKGQTSLMKAGKKDLPLHRLTLRDGMLFEDDFAFGQNYLFSTTPVRKQASAALYISLAQGDTESRIIPNDTGTEIIVEDILRALSCCDAVQAEDCCEGKGGDGKAITRYDTPKVYEAADIEGLVEMSKTFPIESISKAMSGGSWKTIMTLSAADVCLYRYASYLIIVDCITGEIWCMDSSACTILLQSDASGNIQVMVEEDCTAFDSMTPC